MCAHREASRYAGWIAGLNFGGNNEYGDGLSYENWGGYNLLVRLNLQNPEVRRYHLETVRFWAEQFGIDGLRLDTADVLDFGFLRELRAFCDALKPEVWLMGEVIHGDYSRWANASMLHSVTNYELHKALWSGHNDHNYFEIAHSVRRLQGLCGGTRLYTFTDNHDVARIASKLRCPAHFRLTALLQYTLPGIPSLYCGSEFALKAEKQRDTDWNLRPCLQLADFAGDAAAQAAAALFARLGELKETLPALSWGDYRELLLTNCQFAFARTLDGAAIVTVLNCADTPAQLAMALPLAACAAEDLVPAGERIPVRIDGGRLIAELPPNSGTVLALH